jgi:WD40 repeat protein
VEAKTFRAIVHKSNYCNVHFSPDNRMLATIGNRHANLLRLWDWTATPPISHDLSIGYHGLFPYYLTWSPDSQLVAVAPRFANKILVADWRGPYNTFNVGVKAMAFSPDRRLLAVGSDVRHAAHLFDRETGTLLHTLHTGLGGIIVALAFSSSAGLLAAGSQADTVVCILQEGGKHGE